MTLTDANDKGLLPDAINDLLWNWFIENLIAPHTGETPQEVRGRLSAQGQSSFQFLIAVITDANDKGVFPDNLSNLLSGWFIDNLIAPHTGETSEQVRERLSGQAAITNPTIATLVYPPYMADPMNVNERGFKIAILDNLNSPEVQYRVTLSRDEGYVISSNWDTSRCRTFDGLQPGGYGFEVVARNLDGIETEPVRWMYAEEPEKPRDWDVQTRTGNDVPYVRARINEVATLYGLTERARLWMLSDIRVEGLRNEPGYGGYIALISSGSAWVHIQARLCMK